VAQCADRATFHFSLSFLVEENTGENKDEKEKVLTKIKLWQRPHLAILSAPPLLMRSIADGFAGRLPKLFV
jgi:hypothetical protein